MDVNSNRFGRGLRIAYPDEEFCNHHKHGLSVKAGPRELTGALDLVSHFKLLPHHEFFCKNSRPVSVLDTHYLCNVIGDTEIRKGEGMQLDQLVQATLSRDNAACIKPFNLDVLGEAFHLRESASVNLSPAEKGIPTIAVKSKSGSKANDKHKKPKDKHKEKDKKHKRSKEEKEKKREKHDKKKKRDRDDDTNGVKKHKRSKHRRSKIEDVGINVSLGLR